jgi:hypothetical protein
VSKKLGKGDPSKAMTPLVKGKNYRDKVIKSMTTIVNR